MMNWVRNLSLGSRGSRQILGVSIALLSVIPFLSFTFVIFTYIWKSSIYAEHMRLLVVMLAMVSSAGGYLLLRRYPRNIVRIRSYLQDIAQGELPDSIELFDPEDDIQAIEQNLGSVLEELRGKIESLREQLALAERMQQTIRSQADELVAAERQRVMIESLGAACHHIGQPATVLRLTIESLLRRAGTDDEKVRLQECADAAEAISDILEKLRSVGEYRVVPYNTVYHDYLEGTDRAILDIDQDDRESADEDGHDNG
jgi:methyl-accepting chemotaxis protein